MGWKTVKKWLDVPSAVVHIQEGVLSIGTPGIPVLVQVGKDGHVVGDPKTIGSTSQLGAAVRKIGADKDGFMAALAAEDQFESDGVKVYIYNDLTGKVEEHLCEKIGYPNVTHDGSLMFDNVFFSTHEEAHLNGIRKEEGLVKIFTLEKENAETALEMAKTSLKRVQSNLRNLKKGEPKSVAEDVSGEP